MDGDGRFTILFSSWLDHLGGGRHAVDGFVKVGRPRFDGVRPLRQSLRHDVPECRAQARPLSPDRPRPRIYARRDLYPQVAGTAPEPDEPGPEEEGWLDEAIAHLAEDLHGFSAVEHRLSDQRLPLAARALSARGGRLLRRRPVPQPRQPGEHLPVPAMVRRPLRPRPDPRAGAVGPPGRGQRRGGDRLDVRRRSSSMVARDVPERDGPAGRPGRPRPTTGSARSICAPRWPTGSWRGLAIDGWRPASPADCWEAAGTSTHYVILDGRREPVPSRSRSQGPPEAGIQVTALPLGDDHARLDLSLEPARGPGRRRVDGPRPRRRASWRPRAALGPILGTDGPGTSPSMRAAARGDSTCSASPPRSGHRRCRPAASCVPGPSACPESPPRPARSSSRSSAPTREDAASAPGPTSTLRAEAKPPDSRNASPCLTAPAAEVFRVACPGPRGHGRPQRRAGSVLASARVGRRRSMPTKTWACHPIMNPTR